MLINKLNRILGWASRRFPSGQQPNLPQPSWGHLRKIDMRWNWKLSRKTQNFTYWQPSGQRRSQQRWRHGRLGCGGSSRSCHQLPWRSASSRSNRTQRTWSTICGSACQQPWHPRGDRQSWSKYHTWGWPCRQSQTSHKKRVAGKG